MFHKEQHRVLEGKYNSGKIYPQELQLWQGFIKMGHPHLASLKSIHMYRQDTERSQTEFKYGTNT